MHHCRHCILGVLQAVARKEKKCKLMLKMNGISIHFHRYIVNRETQTTNRYWFVDLSFQQFLTTIMMIQQDPAGMILHRYLGVLCVV